MRAVRARESAAIATAPIATAGAGPSRIIANTSATNPEETLWLPTVISSHSPITLSTSSSPTSSIGCHCAAWELSTATATAPASRIHWLARYSRYACRLRMLIFGCTLAL